MKFFALIFFVFHIVFSQELSPFEANGLWGFTKNDQIVIEAKYQFVDKFYDGLAVVMFNNKLGVIDTGGNIVIPFAYEKLSQHNDYHYFTFGFYLKKYPKEYTIGIMDSSQKIIIPCEFKEIRSQGNFYILKRQIITDLGSDKNYVKFQKEYKYGVSDKNGNTILESKYSGIQILKNGYYEIEFNNKSALFNQNFKQLSEFKYTFISDYVNDFAKIRVGNFYGFINIFGEEVIPPEYQRVGYFIDGIAIAKKNKKRGLIDINNNILVDFIYQSIEIPFKNQTIALKDGNWSVINLKNNLLLNGCFEKAKSEYGGITALYKNKKWRIWDRNKLKLGKNKFDSIIFLEKEKDIFMDYSFKVKKYTEPIALVSINNRWGIINISGNFIESPISTLDEIRFISQRFLVKNKGK